MGRKSICRVCKREVKIRTRKGKCLSCIMNKQIIVNRQLQSRKGKYFKRWKHNILEALRKI